MIGHEHILSGENHYPRQRCTLYRAHRASDNQQLVRTLDMPMIARGAGLAYGDSALNEGGAVLGQDRVDRLLDFDPATGQLTCQAGATLDQIIAALLPRGYFPMVTPGTSKVTVGGCIAADVHGKNHHRDGSFAASVRWLDLLTADGSVLRCDSQQNRTVFDATLGGMGLTGIILRAQLQLRQVPSAFVQVRYQQGRDLHAVLAGLDEANDSHYTVAWMDCLARGRSLGRGVVMRGQHAAIDDLPLIDRATPFRIPPPSRRSVPCNAPSWLLNRLSVGLFNAWYYRKHARSQVIEDYRTFFYPLDAVRHWSRLYGQRGFIQYQCVIPDAAGVDPIVRVLERIAHSRRASFLAVLKRLGPGSGGLLSFPMGGLTLALDLPRPSPGLFELTAELDRIVLDHGGRVYLAKDACLSRATFEAMYPQHTAFKALCRELDPHSRFNSSLSRRLGLTDA